MHERLAVTFLSILAILATTSCATQGHTAPDVAPDSLHHVDVDPSQETGETGVEVPSKDVLPETHTLWVLPARVVGSVLHFPDELEAVDEALADFLARDEHGGYEVIAPAELRRSWAEMREGRTLSNDEVCARPSPPALLTSYLHPDAHLAEALIFCDEVDCTLSLSIFEPLRGRMLYEVQDVLSLRLALPGDESPEEWAEAIRTGEFHKSHRLQYYPELPERYFGSVGLHALAEQGDLQQWEMDTSPFKPFAQAFHACGTGESSGDFAATQYLIEVDEDGRVRRCESPTPGLLTSHEFVCHCEIMAKLAFDKGAVRRALFDLILLEFTDDEGEEPPIQWWAAPRELQVDDGSALLSTTVVNVELARQCIMSLTESLDVSTAISMRIASDGTVAETRVEWHKDLPSKVTQCLDRVLAESQFNCPVSGAANISFDLHLEVNAAKLHMWR